MREPTGAVIPLTGAKGNSRTIKARNLENLKKVKVGDMVDSSTPRRWFGGHARRVEVEVRRSVSRFDNRFPHARGSMEAAELMLDA
jgi:hypothetical protein